MPRRFLIVLTIALSVVPGRTAGAGQTPESASQTRQVQVGNVQGDKTVIRRDAMVRRVDAATKEAPLRRDEFIVARWAAKDEETTPTTPGPDRKAWSVGFGFIGIAPDGREIRFRPIIESTGGGLAVSKDANAFTGRVFVGLRDNRDPSASYTLPQPISLLVDGQADDVAPRQLTIDHTNLPFTEVLISSQNPPDTVDLNLIAAGTTERATVNLPVVRPSLELFIARTRIQGLGLETAAVSVRSVGLPNPAGRVINVTSDFASVNPTEVTLNDQGSGSTTVRSVSFGNAVIRAASPPMKPAEETMIFSWPIAFFVAAIVGGVSGAALARIQKSGLPKKRSLQTVVVRGVLTGVIVVALYAIGVNILPIQPVAMAGEVLAFALAAVGGYVGLKF